MEAAENLVGHLGEDCTLDSRLVSFAAGESLSLDEARTMAIQVGLAVLETGEAERRDGIQDLLQKVREMDVALHTIGRQVVAMQRLLVNWAAQSGSSGATEEELAEELEAAGNLEWEARMAQHDVIPPRA